MPPAGAVWGIVSSRHAGPVDESRACLRNRPAPTYINQSVSADLPCFHTTPRLLPFNLTIDWYYYSIYCSNLCCNITSQRLTRCLHPASPSIPSSTYSISLTQLQGKPTTPRVQAGALSGPARTHASWQQITHLFLLLLSPAATQRRSAQWPGRPTVPTVPRATREPLVPRERLYAIALLCTRNSSPYTFTFTSNHPPLVSSHLLSSTSTTGPANHAIHLADTLTHTAVALLPIAYSSFHPPHNPPPCHNPPFRPVLSASPPHPLSTRTCLKSLPVPLANLTLRLAAMSPARPLTSRPLP